MITDARRLGDQKKLLSLNGKRRIELPLRTRYEYATPSNICSYHAVVGSITGKLGMPEISMIAPLEGSGAGHDALTSYGPVHDWSVPRPVMTNYQEVVTTHASTAPPPHSSLAWPVTGSSRDFDNYRAPLQPKNGPSERH